MGDRSSTGSVGGLLFLALVLPWILTACESKESSGVSGPRPGGEFRINMRGEPDTIDPNRSNFSTSLLVASQVFEGLFVYDKDLNLGPGVAAAMPTVANGDIAPDGRTYTFRLRPDSRWSDGRPVTARDFAFAIRRSLDPRVAAPYASALYDIAGAREFTTALGSKDAPRDPSPSELNALREAVGVQAIDDLTLQVRLSAPRPTFLHIMALAVAWPVREDIVTRFGDRWTEPPNYIGNGPFALANWVHQERLEFVPNPFYHGQKPAIAKLVLLQVADANQAYFAYQNGEMDAVAVPDANVGLVMQDPNLKAQIVRFNELTVFGFQFNVKKAPLDNVKVRQAIAMAVDRAALVEKVAQGVGRIAYSAVPPGMPGYEEGLGKAFDFNPTRARALLAEAGYEDRARFPVIVNSFFDNSSNRARAEFFQAQMKQNLGIQVTLEPLDGKTFQQRFNAGQFTVAFSGWGADYPDPDNFVPELFTTESGNNHTGYGRPEVDRLADACRKELDEERRRDACSRAQKIVVEDQPWVFAFYRESLWLVKPYVKGFQPTAKDHLPGSRYYHQLSIVR